MNNGKLSNISILWTIVLIVTYINKSICVEQVKNDRNIDEYLSTVQSECYTSKRLLSCFKYRAARYVWSFATGKINWFEFDNTNKEFANGVKIVQLSEPDSVELFSDARQMPYDNEMGKAIKFMKRALTTFVDGHGIRIGIGTDKGPRIFDSNSNNINNTIDNSITDTVEGRAKVKRKHRKKLNLIFPLAILLKLFHLKFILIKILIGIGLTQLLLIIGGALLFHYLKNNTLCRIQPHLIHSHSHVTTEGELGGFQNSAYGNYPYGPPPYIPGAHANGYNKDWASNRAYSAYPAFQDTANNKH